MRAVFVGAGKLALTTSHILLKRGHEVVIVERDKNLIESLTTEIDCGFVHGDGSTPAILKETDPPQTDVLFCLTGNDQTNIITSLVGRSLGFKKTITRIDNPEFEHICIELGLSDLIVPSGTIGRYLADIFAGRNPLEISASLRDEARLFTFIAKEKHTMSIRELDLPRMARVICVYRQEKFIWPDGDVKLKADDEVVIITLNKHMEELQQKFSNHIRQEPSE